MQNQNSDQQNEFNLVQDETVNIPSLDNINEETVKNEKSQIDNDAEKIQNTATKKVLLKDTFYTSTNNVIKQAFEFGNLKRLNVGAAVLWGIVMSPFLISLLYVTALYYITLFVFKILVSPADYVVNCLKKDSEKSAPQVIIYLFAYPFVALIRVISACLMIVFAFYHLVINCYAFVYTFGGINFHPFLFDGSYKKKEFKKTKFNSSINVLIYVLTILILILQIVILIIVPIANTVNLNSSNGALRLNANNYDAKYDAYRVSGKGSVEFYNCAFYGQIWIAINGNQYENMTIKGENKNYNVYYYYSYSSSNYTSTYKPNYLKNISIDISGNNTGYYLIDLNGYNDDIIKITIE